MNKGLHRYSYQMILAILIVGTVGLNSCKVGRKTSSKSMKENTSEVQGFKQAKKDLVIGEARAICYSGFRSGQHPDRGDGAVNPSYEEILEDLTKLTEDCGFRLMRVYDCGENTQLTLRVIQENNIDMKVLLGVWLRAELSNHHTCAWLIEPIPEEELSKNKELNLLEIEKGIKLAEEYRDIVVAVNVGNEALVDWNDHKVDTDTIISYVKRVKASIDQEVTVADNYEWWASNGEELAKAVDFVSIHIYPVWEGKGIDEAMSYSIANIQKVADSLPGARIVITEAGWATTATEFGERASERNQLIHYRDLMNYIEDRNITTFWFEAFDEDWKGNSENPMGAEKHWGLYKVDRSPKEVVGYIIDNK